MRKRIIAPASPRDATGAIERDWLNLDAIAEIELTSEDPAHPIESALPPGRAPGWRAASAGNQTIRLLFAHPQQLRRIWLVFEEHASERTHEYVVRWSADGGQSFREIVRQQWNFSPGGSHRQVADHHVELAGATALEVMITPDISGSERVVASLAELRLA